MLLTSNVLFSLLSPDFTFLLYIANITSHGPSWNYAICHCYRDWPCRVSLRLFSSWHTPRSGCFTTSNLVRFEKATHTYSTPLWHRCWSATGEHASQTPAGSRETGMNGYKTPGVSPKRSSPRLPPRAIGGVEDARPSNPQELTIARLVRGQSNLEVLWPSHHFHSDEPFEDAL